MQKSIILKTLIRGGTVSLAVVDSTAVVSEGARRHGCSAVAAAAFGRTLTAAVYLCSWLKGKSELAVTVNGGGVGGKICVLGNDRLCMRGFVGEPKIELPPRADGKLDVGGFVGKEGTLTVVYDGGTGVPFTGTSPLVSGEIAEDFSAYFLTSEQRPTAVALGVRVLKGKVVGAGGVFLQPLPGAGEEAVSFCEREIERFRDVSALIAGEGAAGILSTFTGEEPDARPIYYRCHCTRKRAESALLSLGKRDALSLLREEGVIRVHCHYCNRDHLFTEEDVERLFGGNA